MTSVAIRHTRLSELRALRGLTQATLAQLAGVTRASVGRMEKGSEQRFDHVHVKQVAVALGVSPDELIVRERFGLLECQEDVLKRLAELRGDASMRVIGIDLAYGRDNIMKLVQHGMATRLTFQCAILETAFKLKGNSTRTVNHWANAADNNLDELRGDLTPGKLPSGWVFQIKRYAVTPTLHGVAFETPAGTRYYLTTCYTDNQVLYFGDGRYAIFDKHTATRPQAKRMADFERRFQQLWGSTSEYAMNLGAGNGRDTDPRRTASV